MDDSGSSRFVRVCDVDETRVRPPYLLALAQAVRVRMSDRDTLLVTAGPSEREARFLLTSAAYACGGKARRPEEALVLSAGVQYGCSARACPHCSYVALPHVRNLGPREVADLFRLALFLDAKGRPNGRDERVLELELAENGEPLEHYGLPEVLDGLLEVFGAPGRTLAITMSTVFEDNPLSWIVFGSLHEWQRVNAERAQIHLRVSRPLRLVRSRQIIGERDLMTVIGEWGEVNPTDRVAIAPALVLPSSEREFASLLVALEPVAERCVIRITPAAMAGQRNGDIESSMRRLAEVAAVRGYAVVCDPSAMHMAEVNGMTRGADRLFDPQTYTPWRYRQGREDPNIRTNGGSTDVR